MYVVDADATSHPAATVKRRLVGKDGAERIRELRAILAELPGYRNGPYARLRKWVEGELRERCTGARVWGPSARFPGRLVGREYELSDGDTVEILDR